MTEISFYQVMNATPASVDATVPLLLEKALASGKKILVRTNTKERAERLNETLWSYKANSFLPHGGEGDGYADQQPVYITENQDNPNSAEILVLISGAEAPDFEKFDRVLDMFEASEIQQNNARKRYKKYKEDGFALSYFAHEEGRWHKKA